MQKLVVSASLCVLFASLASAGVSVSGDPVVGAVFARRVAERGAVADHPRLSVRFETDARLKGDDAEVAVSNGTAVVRGARRRALMHGAGLLLRQMTWRNGTFSLPDGAWAFRPAVPLRQTYFARQCHNVYYMWNADELARYCEDLMLWGYNSVHVNYLTPLNFKSTFEDEPEARAFMDVYAAMSRRLREIDMLLEDNTMGNLGFLDAPAEYLAVTNRCVERRLPDFGRRVCPNQPGTIDYLVRCQKAVFASMKKRGVELDLVRFWPYDEGGCGCDACHPWGGNGYVRIIDALAPVVREAFPNAKLNVSTWYFTAQDWKAFDAWLKRTPNRPAYVLADDYGDHPFPNYPVEHPFPSGTELITFPETSMYGRFPWGAYGAVAYPDYLLDRYRATKGRARGFCSYSEGIYEDLNKILTCGIYANAGKGRETLCDEYARYELGLSNGARLAELVKLLEANLTIERVDFARATRALDLAEAMEAEMDPAFRTCWRWRELYLRTVIDYEKSRPGGGLHTPASDAAFAELVKISRAEPRQGDYKDPLHRRTRPPSPGPEAAAKGVHPVRPRAEKLGLKPFPKLSAPRAVTSGPHDHFLANYFAINAWSPDNRYLLVLETDIKNKLPDGAPCTLGLVDTADGNRFVPVTTTRCWNFQEAAMAHWMPCEKDTFVFNDIRGGKFCAVVMNWKTKAERVYPFPVSAVTEDGRWAISINYARLFLTRPDYGYAGNGQEPLKDVVFPENDGLWRVDLMTGEAKLIVPTAAVKGMVPAVGPTGMSYLCHTVISKDFSHVYFLSRSVEESMAGVKKFKGVNWFTTAFTCKSDGSEIRRCFPDGWGSSHFNWKPNLSERDARTMIVTCKWLDKIYTHVEFTVGEEDYPRQVGGKVMDFDGHCIYTPDGQFISGDGYWDERFYRHWKMVRLADNAVIDLGSYYIPEIYRDVYCRCDLHPRWRPDGKQIGFNSVHEGSRQVYVMDAE